MAENNHLSVFKNQGKPKEMRQRRQEEMVELRKAKKDDQLMKRRNLEPEEVEEVDLENLDDCLAEFLNPYTDNFQLCIRTIRKFFSHQPQPHMDVLAIQAIVTKCVELLGDSRKPNIQLEATWILTNIAAGPTEYTRLVIEAGSVPILVNLMSSSFTHLAEQAIWALKNIAGDGAEPRNLVFSYQIIPSIISMLAKELSLSCLRTIVWLIANICRNRPPVAFQYVQEILPFAVYFLNHNDFAILRDICWTFAYITDFDNQNIAIQAVIDYGYHFRLVELLGSENPDIITPALRAIGNIITGTDAQTDAVIAANVVAQLAKLLLSPNPNIVREATWSVSNIAAGTPQQIQTIIDFGLIQIIHDVLAHGDFKSQIEAAWVIANISKCGTREQIVHILHHCCILKPFCDLIVVQDVNVIKVILNGILNILEMANDAGELESVCLKIEEVGGFDKIELLQNHANVEISQITNTILKRFFTTDDTLNLNDVDQSRSFSF